MLQLHGDDSDLVDNIIASKVSLGHFRPHSDAPEDSNATMYYVPRLNHHCGSMIGFINIARDTEF